MLFVVSGGSPTASEEQEAQHTTVRSPCGNTARTPWDAITGQPAGASPGPRPLAPRAMARRAYPAGEMWRLLRLSVAARPRHRLFLCGQLMGCCRVRRWARIGRSRPGQGGTLVGRRVRPAQPTWQLRTSVLGDLSLREACLTAVRANMGNVRFLSCGFRSRVG